MKGQLFTMEFITFSAVTFLFIIKVLIMRKHFKDSLCECGNIVQDLSDTVYKHLLSHCIFNSTSDKWVTCIPLSQENPILWPLMFSASLRHQPLRSSMAAVVSVFPLNCLLW